MIEWVTLRVGAHSTSDDPSGYRLDDGAPFPLGDPVDRLTRHLIAIGEWDDERHQALSAEIDQAVATAFAEADSHGSVKGGSTSKPATMFDDVYKEMPRHLREQREQVDG
jgi:2-oxoisovalerate dehydrogenase E1 component alpha subunit